MKPKSTSPFFAIKPLLKSIRTKSFLPFIEKMAEQGEPIINISGGFSSVYLVNHPDAVEQILVTEAKKFYRGPNINHLRTFLGNGLLTNSGQDWREQRLLLQPFFRSQTVSVLAASMDQCITHYLENCQNATQNKGFLITNITEDMLILTQNTILASLFDLHQHPKAYTLHQSLITIQHYVSNVAILESVTIGIGEAIGKKRSNVLYERMIRKHKKAFTEALDISRNFVKKIISDRKSLLIERNNEERTDLFSTLIKAQISGSLTEEQLEDEVTTLFFTGFDTTGHALSWLWYLLAKHPEVQEKIRSEVDALPPNADAPQLVQAPLSYLKAAIYETLRLYPVAWSSLRTPFEDMKIAGYDIPAKASLIISPYTLHRLPEYWPDPEKFDPKRFLNTELPDVKRGYIPFNAGPHTCIGRRLALLEIQLVVIRVLQRFRVQAIKQKQPQPTAQITLAAYPNVKVKLTPR